VYRYASFFSLQQQHAIVLDVRRPGRGRTKLAETTEEASARAAAERDPTPATNGILDASGDGASPPGPSATADQESSESCRDDGGGEGGDWTLLVFDFAPWNPRRPAAGPADGAVTSSSSSSGSCVRVYESGARGWSLVEYGASMEETGAGKALANHLFRRAGTFTAARSGPAGWVRARAEFLRLHPDVLPPYRTFASNAECVAVWCKTGTWATLQASSWLGMTALGQAKSAVTLAGAAGAAQATVPAAGLVR
jgi:hypothetical protein